MTTSIHTRGEQEVAIQTEQVRTVLVAPSVFIPKHVLVDPRCLTCFIVVSRPEHVRLIQAQPRDALDFVEDAFHNFGVTLRAPAHR